MSQDRSEFFGSFSLFQETIKPYCYPKVRMSSSLLPPTGGDQDIDYKLEAVALTTFILAAAVVSLRAFASTKYASIPSMRPLLYPFLRLAGRGCSRHRDSRGQTYERGHEVFKMSGVSTIPERHGISAEMYRGEEDIPPVPPSRMCETFIYYQRTSQSCQRQRSRLSFGSYNGEGSCLKLRCHLNGFPQALQLCRTLRPVTISESHS